MMRQVESADEHQHFFLYYSPKIIGLKMRSAAKPFGSAAIMKKFIKSEIRLCFLIFKV